MNMETAGSGIVACISGVYAVMHYAFPAIVFVALESPGVRNDFEAIIAKRAIGFAVNIVLVVFFSDAGGVIAIVYFELDSEIQGFLAAFICAIEPVITYAVEECSGFITVRVHRGVLLKAGVAVAIVFRPIGAFVMQYPSAVITCSVIVTGITVVANTIIIVICVNPVT